MSADFDAVLDRATFDDFASLFDAAELREMVEEWHADSASALDAMVDALEHDDAARLGEIAHRAAGGGLALGATMFARACEALRATADSGGAVTSADIAQVRAAVAATHAAMAAAAGREAASEEPT